MKRLKKIKVGIEKVNKVYHIADVHIRNLKRHKEYRDVFSQLYGYILSTMDENDIIYIAGDIVHAKTDMSPEVVDLTQEFFTRLADLLPTIVIPGNHDANLNNTSRLDALSPIINALKHPNLFYLKDTGAWSLGDLTIVHQSVWDKSPGFPPSVDYKGDTKIAVFHGPVDKIETEHGFAIENKNINVGNFDGYDMVMLGDIHKPNNAVQGVDTIKYAGSLIVQNHGEAKYPDHGILVWDVLTRTSEFVRIPNDYGYVTVDIEEGKIVSSMPIPQKPRMRVRVKDTKASELNKIIADLKKGRQVQELTIQKVITRKSGSDSEKIVLQNVRDTAFQNKLIEDFLNENEHLTEQQLEVVKGINNDINSKLGIHRAITNTTWIPKKFEFSNMFSYGPNNVVDFSQMKGAYGIFAPNASGKSTLWDALSFCIFDKCSRTSKAEDVMNYSKMSFNCSFTFELNGVDYTIERTAKKSPKRGTVKVNTDFYRIIDGQKESLNGEQRRDTNVNIREYVGTYEDFILTAMSTQSNNSGFIEKSQKERKELLAQFLDMDVFEGLYQIASEEIKELSALLKDYKNQDLPTQLAEAEDTLTSITGSLTDLQDRRSELETKCDNTNIKIEFEMGALKPVEDLGDVSDLEDKLELQQEYINKQQMSCDGVSVSIKKTNTDIKNIQSKLSKFNESELIESDKQYKILDNKFNQMGVELTKLESEMVHSKKHLDGIGSLTFDETCEHCVKNQNTPFAKQAQTLEVGLERLGKEYSTLVSSRLDVMTERDTHDVSAKLKVYNELVLDSKELHSELSKYESEYDGCILRVDNMTLEMESLKEKVTRAKNQQEAVTHNAQIQEKVKSFKITRDKLKDEIRDITTEIMDVNSDIKLAEKTIDMVNTSIDKLRDMEVRFDGYEYYLKCVKRDGIPYNLISDVLPKLEVEINNILQPIVDFQVLLNTDGKNINSYIAYGTEEYWPLELTSGMEKFISSIAIRTALINVSNLPRPNFIAIDEGFGSLDTDNFNSLYLLFDYLKTQFDFIITISHIDKTRDMVDQIIDINKVRGFSKVSYL
jgi:DNA repair exonuclease SbcCD ATPase subunit/DNA repair exonuclease SbcCD nuclease subunit